MMIKNPLDAETVGQIRQLGGDRLLADLVEIYVAQAPLRMREIRVGLDEGDLVRAAKGAHSFRSSSISLGARDLAEEAAALERLADSGDGEGVRRRLSAFEQSVGNLVDFLSSEFGGGV